VCGVDKITEKFKRTIKRRQAGTRFNARTHTHTHKQTKLQTTIFKPTQIVI